MYTSFSDDEEKEVLLPGVRSQDLFACYNRIKKTEATLAIASIIQNVTGLVSVSLISVLNQSGVFRPELRGKIWTFVEVASLVLVMFYLTLGLTSYTYIERKKAQFRKMLDMASEEDYDPNLLKVMLKGVEKPSRILRASSVLEITATLIFLASEVMAVAEIFHPYGLKDFHIPLGLPFNTQCLVELTALTLLLACSVLRVVSADEQRRRESSQSQCTSKKSGVFPYLLLPLFAFFTVTFSTLGKILQGMEKTGMIEIGKDDFGSFPLGHLMRGACAMLAVCLSIYKLFGALAEKTAIEVRSNLATGRRKLPIDEARLSRAVGTQPFLD